MATALGPRNEDLQPPEEDVDDSNEAFVEREWGIVGRDLCDLYAFAGGLTTTAPFMKARITRIQSSLQTIRELTEVKP